MLRWVSSPFLLILFTASPSHAQTRVLWDWNSFDIVENDRIGANYNAHTVNKHVGKSDAYLRDRTINEGKLCASTFWNSYEANYWIRRTLNREDAWRQRAGYPSLFDTIMNTRLYGQIIFRHFDMDPNIAWFHGVYARDYGKVYGANGVRIVMKRVPDNVGPGFIVETAYPEIDPAYSRICG